ncbi:hypothetical protein pb186bvf_003026 [Paramecium bursaria]
MLSKPSFMKIKLPQLNIMESRQNSRQKMSIRSLQLGDRSASPRKLQRATLSTTPKNDSKFDPKKNYYDYRSMFFVDQSFRDTDIQQEKIGQLNKIRNVSGERQLQQIVNRDPRRTSQPNNEPYMPQTASPQKRARQEKQKYIQEKVDDLYLKVQEMLKKHKGYIRQQEKKEMHVKLIQYKKEFNLINQDFNDYYVPIDFKKADDLKFVSHWEALKKLFTGTKTMQKKENIQNMFEIEDQSFQLPTESTPLITEENQEYELTTEDTQVPQQTVQDIESQRSSQQQNNRASIRQSIRPGHGVRPSRMNLQQETTTEQQLPPIQSPVSRRNRSIKIDGERKNRFDLQLSEQGSPEQPPTPNGRRRPVTRNTSIEAQQQLNQQEELQTQPSSQSLRRQMSQRSSKFIQKKTIQEIQDMANQQNQQGQLQNSQHQTRRYYQNNEIDEESEIDQTTDRQRLTEETLSKYDEEQQDIVTPTNTADQTPQYQTKTQAKYQTPISNLSTAAKYSDRKSFQTSPFNTNLLDLLVDAKNIYLVNLNHLRKNPALNTYDHDIQCILDNRYQFL